MGGLSPDRSCTGTGECMKLILVSVEMSAPGLPQLGEISVNKSPAVGRVRAGVCFAVSHSPRGRRWGGIEMMKGVGS